MWFLTSTVSIKNKITTSHQLSDISSGATCVADLDSRALALTKEASGNSREKDMVKLWRAGESQR